MNFEFATAGRIRFGAGVRTEAVEAIRAWGRRVLLVTGSTPARAGWLVERLREAGLALEILPVAGEPTVEQACRGAELARAFEADVVAGVGGGAVLDAAKAVAALATNPGDPLEYLEVIGRGRPLGGEPLPTVLIPTTAGTGSEVTRNAVLGSPSHGVKVSLRSPRMLAKAALVDPELTLDLPPGLTAATGLDALTQLLEPWVCLRANPLVDGFCREGLPRVARSLRRACVDGRDLAARTDLALGSLLGGLALANAGLGAVHGFAGPIGGRFPAPHGAVCAALLAPVMAANVAALRRRQPDAPALARYAEAAGWLTGKPGAEVEDAIRWVRQLTRDLGIPPLSAWGIHPAHWPDLVARAQQASSMKANPVVLTPAELEAILADEAAAGLRP